ncbi:MAG TPA: DUF2911 domain-containing protein [Acidobacteriaceae bacterium]|nr:DUF2911 domain-containing protein [Acidobacteriaceae bacterium]
MKRFLSPVALLAPAALFAAITLPLLAQQPAPRRAPASPPKTASASIGGHPVTITYNSPGVKGREGQIFGPGGLIQKTHKEYPVWRAGANAATTLTTETDLEIGDVAVPKGTYTLFVDISNPDQWTLIISKKTGEWGLAYDSSADLGRVKMQMSKPPQMVENLIWSIDANGNRGTITLAWEDHSASVPVEAAP